MNHLSLQKQLKDNATDLNQFYNELRSWGEDMKKKEQSRTTLNNSGDLSTENKGSVKSNNRKMHCTKEQPVHKYNTKFGYTDYAAWDQFDADAECEKVDYDDNEEEELTDECDETLRDQAYDEKEKGNKFVKNGNWDEAIECYTKAINCYAYDPVFYANRALCFLKKENMRKADDDCTIALKLDKTYVKAYQRRAVAREALNRLEEAELDLLKVLEFEPKNKEGKNSLENLRNKLNKNKNVFETVQRPVSKFTASRKQRRNICQQINANSDTGEPIQDVETSASLNEHLWQSDNNDTILVKTVAKPIHLQSKKPLKRILVSDIQDTENNQIMKIKQNELSCKRNVLEGTLKTDDLKVIERTFDTISNSQSQQMLKKVVNEPQDNKGRIDYSVPRNSLQFYSTWKYLKTLDEKYAYVKLIEPEKLSYIFKDSLDSSIFSDILEVLAKCFIEHGELVFNYLYFFSTMNRFSTISMFLNNNDKSYLESLFQYSEKYEGRSKEEIELLCKKYEL